MSDLFPACYPPRTMVNFQHSVIGIVEGSITRSFLRNGVLYYVIVSECPNTGLTAFVIQSSDVIKI